VSTVVSRATYDMRRTTVSRRRCRWAETDLLLAAYHDREYGVARRWTDRDCFELLSLELFQAGLSWLIVLRKREAFRRAFHRFNLRQVARMTESDVGRLMQDAGIIRNRLKILATIDNARRVLLIQREYGSFRRWLAQVDDADPAQTLKLFRSTFRFMGPEIINEFLMCIGKRPVKHDPHCWMVERSCAAMTGQGGM